MIGVNVLEEEVQHFRDKLPELLKTDEGRIVLIKKSQVIGIYDSRNEALLEGYRRFNGEPFLVNEIEEKVPPEIPPIEIMEIKKSVFQDRLRNALSKVEIPESLGIYFAQGTNCFGMKCVYVWVIYPVEMQNKWEDFQELCGRAHEQIYGAFFAQKISGPVHINLVTPTEADEQGIIPNDSIH